METIDEFEAQIDALTEEELFQREPGAYAMRYAGKSNLEIMLFAMRELLKAQQRLRRMLESYARPVTIAVTEPPSMVIPPADMRKGFTVRVHGDVPEQYVRALMSALPNPANIERSVERLPITPPAADSPDRSTEVANPSESPEGSGSH